MKAVRIHEYGGPEVLRVEEIPRPEPRPRDVLIRVCATSVNPVDWKVRDGSQSGFMRYSLPWILGLDVSGVVEAVGAKVTKFKVGDEVWSSPHHARPGTYAEYTCVDERELSKKPTTLSHEDAASIPLVGLTAYQCLVDQAGVKKGDRVLIHAGAGGVGSFAIQLAKHLGATVITTCSPRNEAFVRELGADEVIDYKKHRVHEATEPVDVVLDTLGDPVFEDNLRVLKRGGRLPGITIDIAGRVARWGLFLSLFAIVGFILKFVLWPRLSKGVRSAHVVKRCDGAQLQIIADLVDQGAIRPVVGEVLDLDDIRKAHEASESHHARGKIVIRVAE